MFHKVTSIHTTHIKMHSLGWKAMGKYNPTIKSQTKGLNLLEKLIKSMKAITIIRQRVEWKEILRKAKLSANNPQRIIRIRIMIPSLSPINEDYLQKIHRVTTKKRMPKRGIIIRKGISKKSIEKIESKLNNTILPS